MAKVLMKFHTLLAGSFSAALLVGCQSPSTPAVSEAKSAPAKTERRPSQALSAVKVVTEVNAGDDATANFKFKTVPAPSRGDAATRGKWTLVDGERDPNGGMLTKLNDGRLPSGGDQPGDNFFFAQGSDGGRIQLDLGSATTIKEINTYSWHPADRGPQVYKLYASAGSAADFKPEPKRGTDPESCGWKMIAKVDSRPKEGQGGGQHGVNIASSGVNIGEYRYLLFDISRTEDRDPFGNTFFSEIDVIDPNAPTVAAVTTEEVKPITKSFDADGGKYHFTIDSTIAPDLTEWADTQLRPVVQEWYPKLVALLPSEGFSPATNVLLRFREDMGGTPASAGGGRINMNAGWFRKELKREARGSIVHEMVHVVQNYGRVRRDDPTVTRMPGWLVEGIPDYIRWYLYEPETKGAEITARGLTRTKERNPNVYDASYRVTGNFLNWVTQKYDKNMVQKLNAAGRGGKYNEAIWKEATGKTLQELGEEWRKGHEERLASVEKKDSPQ